MVFGHAEDDSAEAFGGGEVEVDDCFLCTFQGLDCPLDEVFAAGGEDLEPHIVGDGIRCFDQTPGEVKVCL